MRLFKATYRDRHGKVQESAKWYGEFRDHLQIVRRVPLYTDRKASEDTGHKIEQLVALRLARVEPDANLVRWLEGLDGRLVASLAGIGLLAETRVSASKPLTEHIAAWAEALKAKGITEQQRGTVERQVQRITELCGWHFYGDITAADVRDVLAKLRQRINAETSNHYLISVKAFCRWMVREKLALSNPASCVPLMGKKALKQDQRHPRRVVSPAEVATLLSVTIAAPSAYGMSGAERALLYRVAVETGLRANELRQLRRQCLHLDVATPFVEISDGSTKNANNAEIPLLPATAELLRAHTANMMPTAKVFRMPDACHLIDMFQPDLVSAGIEYIDAAGYFFDFHSLRCCTATFLLDAGVSPKVVQEIMRHASITTTMKYAKATRMEKRAEALTKMPSLETEAAAVREATTDSVVCAVASGTPNAKQNAKQNAKTESGAAVNTYSVMTSRKQETALAIQVSGLRCHALIHRAGL